MHMRFLCVYISLCECVCTCVCVCVCVLCVLCVCVCVCMCVCIVCFLCVCVCVCVFVRARACENKHLILLVVRELKQIACFLNRIYPTELVSSGAAVVLYSCSRVIHLQ